MGAYVCTSVHYREDDICKAAQVVADNPPMYDVFDLVVTELGVNDEVVQTGHSNVQIDTAEPPVTNGRWHYICPADVEGF